ncbi:hypothetical protein CDO52_01535 [Nocardiopsis gilva YIM 90087]|uniref:Uncharacterized protein n=2 Tax=Nocardiopsis gilva TaxID=280236 RepID=A0A223S0J6_9ACTN|nr:hypothetical protein CDO52_01535 [Nocardiopsis gilva YIM 90087]
MVEQLTLAEHAWSVIRKEAERRGVRLELDDEVPDYIPERARLWACKVTGKGWCLFTAVDSADVVTLPSQREFLPARGVLAGNWRVTAGTGSVHLATGGRTPGTDDPRAVFAM